MTSEEKLNTLSFFLRSKDFSYISSIWSSLNVEEKNLFKNKIMHEWKSEEIEIVFQSLLFVSRVLAYEIFGLPKKEELKNIKKGKNIKSFEKYIDFKVEYLQAFKEKLENKGFDKELVLSLISQELIYLNYLSLGGKGHGTI